MCSPHAYNCSTWLQAIQACTITLGMVTGLCSLPLSYMGLHATGLNPIILLHPIQYTVAIYYRTNNSTPMVTPWCNESMSSIEPCLLKYAVRLSLTVIFLLHFSQ